MSEQPPLDATFFAFKKRERSFVLTSAAIAYYLVLVLITVGFLALTRSAWEPLIAWYVSVVSGMSSGAQPAPPPRDALLALAPYTLASIPISLLAFAAFEAACLRWLVRGEAGGGLFGLKLDADTWRVLGVYLCWIVYFALTLVALGLCYAAFIALGSLGGAAQIIAMLLGALAPIAFIWVQIWGAVSFAPAAATSVGRKKLTFLSTRKVSGPRYWPLLTAYFLVIIGYCVIAGVIGAIIQIPINNASAPVMAAVLAGGDNANVLAALQEAFFTPVMIGLLAANLVISLALGVLYYIAMFGVNARAFEAAVEAGDVARAEA